MSGPAHRVQSAVEEFGYPQGHLGHLSAEQENAFQNFKLLCAEHGYYKPGDGADEKPTHDDALLLRFLRARRFIVPDAWKQFQDTEDWRKANQLDQLYETIDLENYEETRQLYPQWTGRRDRRGIPVYVFEVKHLNAKTMHAYEKSAVKTKTKAETNSNISPKLLRLFALYENLTRFVMPLCTQLTDRENPQTPITQSNNIVDISGVGLKQFWNLRSHMQDASTLATAHYPETLDRIFIIGAPAFFPTVWGWIKKWFDPITTSKIFILGNHEMKVTLEKFIDPVNIPKKYGGQLEFAFGDLPILDPALKQVVQWEGSNTDFPHGPMYWQDKKDSSIEAIAVGTVNEKERLLKVCVVKKQLKDDEAQAPIGNGNRMTRTETLRSEAGIKSTLPAELLQVPTAPPTPMSDTTPELPLFAKTEPELGSEKSPSDGSFKSATEGLDHLSLNGVKAPSGVAAAPGPHITATANKLDPAMGADGKQEL